MDRGSEHVGTGDEGSGDGGSGSGRSADVISIVLGPV